MFWKAEIFLFHLETTPLHSFHFLTAKNKDLQISVDFLLLKPSLIMWDAVFIQNGDMQYATP